MFEERYLVFDVVNVNGVLDEHGLPRGDEILVELASNTRARYGAADVYRFGGDDFLVRLGRREPQLPPHPGRTRPEVVRGLRARSAKQLAEPPPQRLDRAPPCRARS